MLFSVLCTMLLGLCIMKREGRRVIMSLWRIVPCHCSARSGFPRLKPARVAFAPFARQKAFSFALEKLYMCMYRTRSTFGSAGLPAAAAMPTVSPPRLPGRGARVEIKAL